MGDEISDGSVFSRGVAAPGQGVSSTGKSSTDLSDLTAQTPVKPEVVRATQKSIAKSERAQKELVLKRVRGTCNEYDGGVALRKQLDVIQRGLPSADLADLHTGAALLSLGQLLLHGPVRGTRTPINQPAVVGREGGVST